MDGADLAVVYCLHYIIGQILELPFEILCSDATTLVVSCQNCTAL
jgi:hypothetical protein